jgi:lipid-A-disaccharide synthase
MRYYLVAGERSGDLHGGNLVKAIRGLRPDSLFRGFGGDYMRDAGVEITVHYADLAFMGFAEVVSNLNKISRFIKQCKSDILAYKPDVIILIDYGGFNTRIAKFASENNIRVFYYITPKVWAWYQKRALTLKKNVDRMFVILPFEKEFYKKFDWDVDYVGSPVLDAVRDHKPDPQFLSRHHFTPDATVVALLPGSRKQELLNILPLLAEIVKRFQTFEFGVAVVGNLDQKLYKPLADMPNVRFIEDQTYDLLMNARAAIVTSGTATLETALLKVPQVVVYKTSRISYQIAKSFIQVRYISLVNLIADRTVIKEFIQQDANPDKLTHELVSLVSDEQNRKRIIRDYDEIYGILDVGSASANAARLMTKYMDADNG